MTNIITLKDSLYNNNKQVHDKVLKRFSVFDGLGLDLTEYEDYKKVLWASGLDYTAEKRNIFLGEKAEENAKEETVLGRMVPDNFAVVKSDDPTKILGVVGKQYTCVSNEDAFSVAEELYKEGYARYEMGGPCLGAKDKIDYSRTFLVMRGDDFKVGDDPYNSFTVLNNSFDGSTGVNFQVLCQRVWCLNMATRYLAGKKNQLRINIQHSKTANDRIKEANKIVIKQQEVIRMIQKEAEAFMGVTFSKHRFEKEIIPLILKQQRLVIEGQERQRGNERVEQVIANICEAYMADDTQNYNNTAYKVILAISDWETHASPLKDTGNRAIYYNRIAKGMLATTVVAQYIASQAGFDMKKFQ